MHYQNTHVSSSQGSGTDPDRYPPIPDNAASKPMHPIGTRKFAPLCSLLTAVALLGAVCTSAASVSLPASAVVRHAIGSVTYIDQNGNVYPATQGTVLHQGDTLQTGLKSSVDLHLPETDATVGLRANATLAIQRLSYTRTDNGQITDTLLDLKSGELVSKVGKQKPGSQFLVSTPNNTTSVRGTEFFIDSKSGDVHVTSGTVVVYLEIQVEEKRRRAKRYKEDEGEDEEIGDILKKTFTVRAGESLRFPKLLKDDDELEDLAVKPTPWARATSFQQWLLQHTRRFDHYDYANSTSVAIQETFRGIERGKGSIWLIRPPEVEVISY